MENHCKKNKLILDLKLKSCNIVRFFVLKHSQEGSEWHRTTFFNTTESSIELIQFILIDTNVRWWVTVSYFCL